MKKKKERKKAKKREATHSRATAVPTMELVMNATESHCTHFGMGTLGHRVNRL